MRNDPINRLFYFVWVITAVGLLIFLIQNYPKSAQVVVEKPVVVKAETKRVLSLTNFGKK